MDTTTVAPYRPPSQDTSFYCESPRQWQSVLKADERIHTLVYWCDTCDGCQRRKDNAYAARILIGLNSIRETGLTPHLLVVRMIGGDNYKARLKEIRQWGSNNANGDVPSATVIPVDPDMENLEFHVYTQRQKAPRVDWVRNHRMEVVSFTPLYTDNSDGLVYQSCLGVGDDRKIEGVVIGEDEGANRVSFSKWPTMDNKQSKYVVWESGPIVDDPEEATIDTRPGIKQWVDIGVTVKERVDRAHLSSVLHARMVDPDTDILRIDDFPGFREWHYTQLDEDVDEMAARWDRELMFLEDRRLGYRGPESLWLCREDVEAPIELDEYYDTLGLPRSLPTPSQVSTVPDVAPVLVERDSHDPMTDPLVAVNTPWRKRRSNVRLSSLYNLISGNVTTANNIRAYNEMNQAHQRWQMAVKRGDADASRLKAGHWTAQLGGAFDPQNRLGTQVDGLLAGSGLYSFDCDVGVNDHNIRTLFNRLSELTYVPLVSQSVSGSSLWFAVAGPVIELPEDGTFTPSQVEAEYRYNHRKIYDLLPGWLRPHLDTTQADIGRLRFIHGTPEVVVRPVKRWVYVKPYDASVEAEVNENAGEFEFSDERVGGMVDGRWTWQDDDEGIDFYRPLAKIEDGDRHSTLLGCVGDVVRDGARDRDELLAYAQHLNDNWCVNPKSDVGELERIVDWWLSKVDELEDTTD